MIDLSQVHLTRREYRTLCAVARGREVSITAAAPLERLGLVDIVPTDYRSARPAEVKPLLSAVGARYIEWHKRDRLRFWLPVLISAAALIRSFWPELRALWALLSKRPEQ